MKSETERDNWHATKAFGRLCASAAFLGIVSPTAQADTFSEVAIGASQPTDFTNAPLTVGLAPAGFPPPLSSVTITFSGEFTSSIILTNTSNQTQSFTATLNSLLTYFPWLRPVPVRIGRSLTRPAFLGCFLLHRRYHTGAWRKRHLLGGSPF
jgi:hypothetical protein